MRILNEYGQELSDEFESAGYSGCTCFLSPPCSFCTHPGNPLCLEENDEAWEDVTELFNIFEEK